MTATQTMHFFGGKILEINTYNYMIMSIACVGETQTLQKHKKKKKQQKK